MDAPTTLRYALTADDVRAIVADAGFDDAYEAVKRDGRAQAWEALAGAALDALDDAKSRIEELEEDAVDLDCILEARRHIFEYGDMANGRFWFDKALDVDDGWSKKRQDAAASTYKRALARVDG